MSDRYFISEADLRGLAADLLGAGTEVVGPVATDICQSPSAIAATACTLDHSLVDIDYRSLTAADELDLSRGLPQLSLKGYFLPEHEGPEVKPRELLVVAAFGLVVLMSDM